MAALPQMISLKDAVKKVRGATIDDLRPLVEKGKIKGATINGEIYVNALTLPAEIVKKETADEYENFSRLAGVKISIGEAARKYKVPQPNLSKWKKKGLIAEVGKEKNKILVNEQDVAYCVAIYKKHSKGKEPGKLKGHWLFTETGAPRPVKHSKRRPIAA